VRAPDNHGIPRPGPLPPAAAGLPAAAGDEDAEWAQYTAWLDREAADGREPEPWPVDDDELWDCEPWDPELDNPGLGARGPEGPVRPLFAEDGAGDVMPPGPALAALTEQAVADVARLSDSELVGVLRASQRLVAREHYKQVQAAAEFGRRRRAAFEGALARGVPAGCAAGGFPGEELAAELVISRGEAGHLIDDAIDLTGRLPRTLTGMAAGLIDAGKAGWIAFYTRSLNPADTAYADQVLAEAAPELRSEQLARKGDALEKKLNPEGARARKEHAKRDGQRVEARREASGNASLAGRELDTADVLASKAYLDAVAARLRECGIPGSLNRLRALAMTDLTQGRNPLDRISPAPAGPPSETGPADDGDSRPRPAAPGPVPALINLIIPAGTLFGSATAPAQADAWGLLDRDETRQVGAAAAAHPATRWCVTLTGPDGTAIAHGCARGPRPRLLDDLGPQPPPGQAAQLTELLRRLNIAPTPITRGPCDHTAAESGYAPSRKLQHLVRARSATCDAPGCQNPAVTADLDHTRPWPDGPTDQCNLSPRCRTHHRAKQAPDWTVKQLAPGVTRWTLPSGRSHLTTPTKYDT
jgi:Domain of unknown function (DUF222)